MAQAEALELLDELLAHSIQEKYQYRHQWRIGDLVMWDNRCTMHCRAPFPAAERRLMKRTQGTGRVSF